MKFIKLFSKTYKINNLKKQRKSTSLNSGRWLLFKINRDKCSNDALKGCVYSIVAFSEDGKSVLKVEIRKHPRKINSLQEEVEKIKFLNKYNCTSAPKIISSGKIKHQEISELIDKAEIPEVEHLFSYNSVIMEKLHSDSGYTVSDIIISLLEQKSLGIYHGDIKPDNICFDSNTGVCYFIDYDQSEFISQSEKDLNAKDYLEWCDKKEFEKYGYDSWIRHFKGLKYKRHINWLLKDGAFNIATTTPYKKQVTTNTKSGVYHTIKSSIIFADGIRDFKSRMRLLDMVEFKANEKVLDVGCNAGLLTHYLYKRNCIVTGMEMDSWLVTSAKIISNVFNYNIDYQFKDLDNVDELVVFDTICLFSVIHHTQNLYENGVKIANSCKRILIECRLRENGHKPIVSNRGKVKWVRSSIWDYDSENELIKGMEKLFPKFELSRVIGKADKGRFLLELTKQ
jgi:2-polyprenyl-3-methyl-5-hydroxy-6-metoxy-1,4-benzoquinol methylase